MGKKKEELNIAAGAVRTWAEKKDSEENEPTSVPSDVTVDNADASPTPTTSNALDNTKDDQQQQQQQQQHGNGERNGGRGGGRGRGRGGERKNNSRGTSGRGGRGGRGKNNRRNSERNRNSNQSSSKDPDGWDEAKGGLPPQQPTTKAPLVERKNLSQPNWQTNSLHSLTQIQNLTKYKKCFGSVVLKFGTWTDENLVVYCF